MITTRHTTTAHKANVHGMLKKEDNHLVRDTLFKWLHIYVYSIRSLSPEARSNRVANVHIFIFLRCVVVSVRCAFFSLFSHISWPSWRSNFAAFPRRFTEIGAAMHILNENIMNLNLSMQSVYRHVAVVRLPRVARVCLFLLLWLAGFFPWSSNICTHTPKLSSAKRTNGSTKP